MRILAAAAHDVAAVGDAMTQTDPLIAAVSSITPADACTIATKHALRYAVQCWDVPEEGKAIFWKPALLLQGLYRSQFQSGDPQGAPSGMLRVTFLWNGEPLHVTCAQVSAVVEDAGQQIVQLVKEIDAARGAGVFAVDAGEFVLPSLPRFEDVWLTARLRAVAYGARVDLARTSKVAFGIPVPDGASGLTPADIRCSMRLYCSGDFSVSRTTLRYPSPPPSRACAVVADVTLVAEPAPERANGTVRAPARGRSSSFAR